MTQVTQQVSIRGAFGEIGTVEVQVAEGDNIIDLTTWTADGGGSTSLRLDVAEALELIRRLTEGIGVALQNS